MEYLSIAWNRGTEAGQRYVEDGYFDGWIVGGRSCFSSDVGAGEDDYRLIYFDCE